MKGITEIFIASSFLAISSSMAMGAIWLNSPAPDWDQPVPEGATKPPNWDAWCAPTSASNLAGFWEDGRGAAVGDGSVYPNTPGAYKASAKWKDYLADGTGNRPTASGTDIGWYMDTNNIGGNLGNGPHTGTYLKDVHAGLGLFLNTVSSGWTTGTQGLGYAAGTNSAGNPASQHASPLNGFNEIQAEIDANRPVVVSWLNWNITTTSYPDLNPQSGSTTEAQFGGSYYQFTATGTDPWGNAEFWNEQTDGEGLGHATMAVGYIAAGDADDPTGDTDWVIVHDNVSGTPQNVIVPVGSGYWVANTNAIPEPEGLAVVLLGITLVGVVYRRVRGSLN